ncbi:hypothetical protein MPSEU_000148000 [Mayamaea pseudoterrestris]|nr:hypothetical protein MPSEU_000148000 [Mayamaea pseudoterrestris]
MEPFNRGNDNNNDAAIDRIDMHDDDDDDDDDQPNRGGLGRMNRILEHLFLAQRRRRVIDPRRIPHEDERVADRRRRRLAALAEGLQELEIEREDFHAAAANDDNVDMAGIMLRQNALMRVMMRRDLEAIAGDENNIGNDNVNNELFHGLQERLERAQEREREREELLFGPGLYNLLTQGDLTCTCALRGSNVNSGCQRIVQRCRAHSNEVHHQNRHSRRTPLHEAAARLCCVRVMESIINAVPGGGVSLLTRTDENGMTPFMCFLKGLTTRRVDTKQLHAMMTLLLGPTPEIVAGIYHRNGYSPLHIALAAPEAMIPIDLLQRIICLRPQSIVCRSNNAGQTSLHTHCERPNASVDVAQLLLDAPRPVFIEGVTDEMIMVNDHQDGYTPFHYAARNGNTEMIRLFLTTPVGDQLHWNEGIPAVARRSRGTQQTPLHIACQHHARNKELIRLLLNAAPEAASMRDAIKNSTPIHLLCKQALISIDCIRAFIAVDPDCLQIGDANSYLPLHYVCESGSPVDIINSLLAGYPHAASVMTRKQDSALSLACAANRSPPTVQLLIKTFPGAIVKMNQYGFIPLHCACRGYQPKLAIIQALVRADSNCTTIPTLSGDVAIQLAQNNKSTSMVVLEYLKGKSDGLHAVPRRAGLSAVERQSMMVDNKKGNNPLHSAILRLAPVETIETTAISNSRWISMRNNAGYTPLQLLCKNSQADVSIIGIFAQIGGPSVFAITDEMGNTPLHSAMQQDASVAFLEAVIRAYPEALHMKTIYDDTPLHLACKHGVHPDGVGMLAMMSSVGLELTLSKGNTGRLSPILMENSAGQTPITIAMENYQRICLSDRLICHVKSTFDSEKTRAFDLLATLVKILHYGPVDRDELGRPLSLVGACISLHRKDVRLDPAFIRRALYLHPEDALQRDKDGNYPLHVESSIPVEKMMLLEPERSGCCGGACQKRSGIVRNLFEVYPDAACQLNEFGEFPLSLMALAGRAWDDTFMLVVQKFPEAIYAVEDLDSYVIPLVLAKLYSQCGIDTVYAFMRGNPHH